MYAIKDVSDITGVNSVTLRAWQRRYGLINPQRTEKGHRLYSQQDINKIKEILSWLEKGVAIGKVRPLLEGKAVEPLVDELNGDRRQAVESLLTALNAMDAKLLHQRLILLMKEYPEDVFETQIADKLNGIIDCSDNPLLSIQSALWRNVLNECCMALVAASRKRNKKPCLLLSFDPQPSYRVWLKASQLAHLGYSVTMLTEITGKLIPLISVMNAWPEKVIYLDGDHKIERAELVQLDNLLRETTGILHLSGSLASIHPELLEWQYEPS
ncbi:MerR family transcriptional regulator [Photobacterium nomapromontoriensis]|uniref:MerR family transcriptional regulator n=1 Tax=Photobacterium nomapromontoriensis TaxID=2910237 RepID=UPI003D145211